MKREYLTLEILLYVLAFGLALLIRLIELNDTSLSDSEAIQALQALQVARGENAGVPPSGVQPVYVFLTGMIFFLFGDGNVQARIVPVILGSSLVLLPLFFRRPFGRVAGVILAFGLAFDPGMVAASRCVGTPILALGFSSLALGLWYIGRPIGAVIAATLAALSGPPLVTGVLALGLTLGLGRLVGQRYFGVRWFFPFTPLRLEDEKRPSNVQLLTTAVVTLVVVGTTCLLYPQGLNAFANAIPVYLSNWVAPLGVPVSYLLIALIVYQPLALIFGLLNGVKAWFQDDNLGRWLSLGCLVAFIIVLIYPGRQVIDLVWLLLPLWALAARELAYWLDFKFDELPISVGHTGLILLLSILFWLNLVSLTLPMADLDTLSLRVALIGGVFILGILATILIGLGWSYRAALNGLVWGVGLSLGLYVVAAVMGVARARLPGEIELWAPLPVPGDYRVLQQSLGEVAEWHTGSRKALDIDILVNAKYTDVPSLRWALRQYSQVTYVSSLERSSLPAVVLTEVQPELNLTQSYRGEAFAWWGYPAWQTASWQEWLRWVTFRQIPLRSEYLILWVRSDIFPGGKAVSQ